MFRVIRLYSHCLLILKRECFEIRIRSGAGLSKQGRRNGNVIFLFDPPADSWHRTPARPEEATFVYSAPDIEQVEEPAHKSAGRRRLLKLTPLLLRASSRPFWLVRLTERIPANASKFRDSFPTAELDASSSISIFKSIGGWPREFIQLRLSPKLPRIFPRKEESLYARSLDLRNLFQDRELYNRIYQQHI